MPNVFEFVIIVGAATVMNTVALGMLWWMVQLLIKHQKHLSKSLGIELNLWKEFVGFVERKHKADSALIESLNDRITELESKQPTIPGREKGACGPY